LLFKGGGVTITCDTTNASKLTINEINSANNNDYIEVYVNETIDITGMKLDWYDNKKGWRSVAITNYSKNLFYRYYGVYIL